MVIVWRVGELKYVKNARLFRDYNLETCDLGSRLVSQMAAIYTAVCFAVL